MPSHSETRELPFSAEQMYDLVADIGRYPEFLPWVTAIRIRSDTSSETLADMIVGFKSLRESFSSRVLKQPKSMITVDYIDGPMKHLHNEWHFRDRPNGGCVIEFSVDFAFKNMIFEAIAGQFFDKALRKMTDAFIVRAEELYAK
jgi:coenzyme Q-binding protein COQ10